MIRTTIRSEFLVVIIYLFPASIIIRNGVVYVSRIRLDIRAYINSAIIVGGYVKGIILAGFKFKCKFVLHYCYVNRRLLVLLSSLRLSVFHNLGVGL